MKLLPLLLLLLPAVGRAQFTYSINFNNNNTFTPITITITGVSGNPTTVVIPSTLFDLPVTAIGNSAFIFCSSLTNITIPNSVTIIGNYSFYGCSGLTSVTIPNNVTTIGNLTFYRCSGLTNITVGDMNATYCSIEGVLLNKSKTTLIAFPGGKSGGYTISNGVTTIGTVAFSANTNLTGITIPNSVTSIEGSAFAGCSSLTNIILGNSVTTVGSFAFSNCPMTHITIPINVTNIGDGAFDSCTRLTNVYFRGNTPSLGVFFGIFSEATNATVYYLPGTTGWGATYGGQPTKLWNPQAQTSDASFGVRTNQFGFNLTGSSNLVIVVEASTNLQNWSPVSTNTLNTFVGTSGTAYFSDPQWTNYPGRFYRLRSP